MRLIVSKNTVFPIIIGMIFTLISCRSKTTDKSQIALKGIDTAIPAKDKKAIKVGANRTDIYLPFLKGKRIGVVANQTSVIFKHDDTTTKMPHKEHHTHIIDSLLALNVSIKKVFAPEHGFRGKADAGELVKDGIDTKTQLPLVSLYGANKKPSAAQLKDLDLIVFDIQDVGVRFYTYISTLHYIMEACAEQHIPLLVLDRPNPNGHYIDGPILEDTYKSFVGLHPIPIVHGMTIGEYAKMINGEHWLKNGVTCDLKVISVENYTHDLPYWLPIKPSPNLPNATAIHLYPSLGFFEGTTVSAGRGTETQFQIFGSPHLDPTQYPFTFTPQPNFGAKHPKHENILCYGKDLSATPPLTRLNLNWLISAYQHSAKQKTFFTPYFLNLAGTKTLQTQIIAGQSAQDIKASWQDDLQDFKTTRSKYLIYD